MFATTPRHTDGLGDGTTSLPVPEMRANLPPASLIVRAPAKVNLFLEVLGKRSDGYHDIVTCMVAVTLHDTLTLSPGAADEAEAIRLTCDDPTLSVGPDNLVWRAAEALRQKTGVNRGVRIHLNKLIPAAAGLAGGSSDAAATLRGLNQLWNLGLSATELAGVAASLGSDVPFFLTASAAWCTGRGEVVTPFALKRPLHMVLICPPVGLATAAVYRGVTAPAEPRSRAAMQEALKSGSVSAIGSALFNRLQPVAEDLCPEVAALRQVMTELAPPGHVMSGSGSSYVALCRSRADARALMRQVLRKYSSPGNGPNVGPGLRLFVVRSCG